MSFIAGLFVGCFIGIGLMCLCRIADDADSHEYGITAPKEGGPQ